jgi:hypothetical protein
VSKKDLPLFNLDLSEHRRMLVNYVKNLRGVHRVEITKVRDQRSLAQNAYLWAVVYQALAQAISEAWGERIDVEYVHSMCKDMFLRVPVVNKETGEVVAHRTRGTSELDKAEFSEYVDSIAWFALEQLDVEIPPPAHYEAVPA